MSQIEPRVAPRLSVERVAIFDKAFLEHCTMGDKHLMAEIVGLFHSQVEKTAVDIIDAETSAEWKFHAHTLKGAAAAVGAGEIEMLASAWENRAFPKRFSEREALRTTLEQAAKAYFAEYRKLR
jgi:HPt (histidine-containing phosphotransfer) domain-containing protein